MRKIILIIFLFTGMYLGKAQIHEFGVFIGGSNYVGEIGSTNYISPNNLAGGVLYKWNKSSKLVAFCINGIRVVGILGELVL